MSIQPLVKQFTALGLVAGMTACAGASAPLGKRLIEPFDFQGVKLDASPMRRQVEETMAFYLRIPDDNLLKGFRQRAGRPAPGNALRGWYSNDTFHVFGQIISGLARHHAATGNVACRDKANRLLAEWAKCIEPDGYFYYSRKPNAPHYTYDKMMWGLLDAHLYCANQEALCHMSRITDWAIKNLERTRQLGHTGSEWYTLSENLYHAWLVTGDPKYRDFARVWEYTEYWDIYARNDDIFARRPDGKQTPAYHAYSHVNTLGGAGAAYLATGEPRYLDILKNAYDYLQAHETFVTGGYGPAERLRPHQSLVDDLYSLWPTFETQCGSWAAFKLCRYLMSFTGNARYGDWVERLVYNGIGASIPMTPDGRVFYYSSYQVNGADKQNIEPNWCWSCCTGTRPQAIADYLNQTYFKDESSLYVNLFTSSRVSWTRQGQPISLRQTTRFPEEPGTAFKITLKRPAEFAIMIRNPAWLAAPMSATVNDQAVELPVNHRHWAVVRRLWKNGDQLSLQLPMKLAVSSFDVPRPYPAAITVGPVVLAFQTTNSMVFKKLDLKNPDQSLQPVPRKPLTWRLAGDPSIRAQPFYAFREGEPYSLYFDPTEGDGTGHNRIRFKSRWNATADFHFSAVVGATAEYTFHGTGIRWRGARFDDAGRAEVSIDGKVVTVVDQYGPGRGLPFDWSLNGLAQGRHTIRLELLDEKSPQSRGRFINVAGFEVTSDGGK